MESNHYIKYGNQEINFSLNFKDRKTLAIHVYPDRSIKVDAPANTSFDKIVKKVSKRAKWIRKQQRYFEKFPPVLPVHKYISGESFRYLGRQYTLKVEESDSNDIKMLKGMLHVKTVSTQPCSVKKIVDSWYKSRSHKVFEERFSVCLKEVKKKVNIQYNGHYVLRNMKTRWGSCSKKHTITLNPELIGASKECIDYVIIHELCHIEEYNHSKRFYHLLEGVLPEWRVIKEKLEMSMEHRLL